VSSPTTVGVASGSSASPGARALLFVFRAYQMLRAGRVSPCRFTPSCSQYAVEAVSLHGAWRGLGLTVRRLARCHPGGSFGYDPVPDAATRRSAR
jgi:putative membrane protein insertion efficiency factor